ncbi:MAG: hypothetical protein ABII79_07135 [bacterium]
MKAGIQKAGNTNAGRHSDVVEPAVGLKCYFLLAVAFSITLCLSCSAKGTLVMYDGERKPPSRVATIDISAQHVFVMRVDTLSRRYEALREKYVEILPGPHILEVTYRSKKGTSDSPMPLEFSARAGHTYEVKAKTRSGRWSAWIMDLADSSIVAGHRY